MDYVGCTIKQLPPHELTGAARTAVAVNPANAPAAAQAAWAVPLPPAHLALLTSRYWGAQGVSLTVSFLDGPDAETRRLILLHANAWGEHANVLFTETASQGQVRIARGQGGYYSYLGTDILHVDPGQSTMNLQGFTARTPESEYTRVVKHEFGHTLGFPHEHLRRGVVSRLDPRKTITYFGRTQGWDAQTVRQQVLTTLDDADLTALPVDTTSIMCYALPAEITLDGHPIQGGTDIDPEDHALAARLYPRGPGPGKAAAVQVLDAAGAVLESWKVA